MKSFKPAEVRFPTSTRLFLAVSSGAILVACAGGASSLLSRGEGVLPAAVAPAAASPMKLAPSKLSLQVGASTAVSVSEKGYTGHFKSTGKCSSIASWSPASGKGPKFNLKVTGNAPGFCSIKFSDSQRHSAELPVKVNPSPTPTPSQIFSYTGAAQSFTVPAGVTHITVVAYGASGGGTAFNDASPPGNPEQENCGGAGGSVTATIPVTPGEQL